MKKSKIGIITGLVISIILDIRLTLESLSTHYSSITRGLIYPGYERASNSLFDIFLLFIISLLICIIFYLLFNIAKIKKEGLKDFYSFIIYHILTIFVLVLPYIM